ncbi:hypothetical protein ACFLT0_00935 [Chloroflexota bacterium]
MEIEFLLLFIHVLITPRDKLFPASPRNAGALKEGQEQDAEYRKEL